MYGETVFECLPEIRMQSQSILQALCGYEKQDQEMYGCVPQEIIKRQIPAPADGPDGPEASGGM